MIDNWLLVEFLSKYSDTNECLNKKGELVCRPIRSYKLSNTHFKF